MVRSSSLGVRGTCLGGGEEGSGHRFGLDIEMEV